MARDDRIRDLVDRLELPFNSLGIDPYGISKKHLVVFFGALGFLYRHYFRVKCHGTEHVPKQGRAMVIGNHSGGVAFDGAMVLTSLFLEMDPPRLASAMAEKFINKLPISSLWSARTGQFTGLPEHALRLLEDDRVLIVFPEGARGTAKLYKERYSMVDFGTGFMRLALKTKTPIVPCGFLGGGAAFPTIVNLPGKMFGVPYIPLTAYLAPVPLPVPLEVHYGEAMHFVGTGNEDDAVINGYVGQVKSRIAQLIDAGRAARKRGRS